MSKHKQRKIQQSRDNIQFSPSSEICRGCYLETIKEAEVRSVRCWHTAQFGQYVATRCHQLRDWVKQCQQRAPGWLICKVWCLKVDRDTDSDGPYNRNLSNEQGRSLHSLSWEKDRADHDDSNINKFEYLELLSRKHASHASPINVNFKPRYPGGYADEVAQSRLSFFELPEDNARKSVPLADVIAAEERQHHFHGQRVFDVSDWVHSLILLADVLVKIHTSSLILITFSPKDIVLYQSDKDTWMPYFTDFGQARMVETPFKVNQGAELEEQFLECHPELAPEVISGETGPHTDVYQLGLLMMSFIHKLGLPLEHIADPCIQRDYTKRPSIDDILDALQITLFHV